MTRDLEFWLDGAPVIDLGDAASRRFECWVEGAPMLVEDPPVTRRRATVILIV